MGRHTNSRPKYGALFGMTVCWTVRRCNGNGSSGVRGRVRRGDRVRGLPMDDLIPVKR